MKGILPTPRKIFTRDDKRTSSEYFKVVTPEPKEKAQRSTVTGNENGLVEWKARMATLRRQNLREGLVELRERKEETARRNAVRGARKEAEFRRRVFRPEREDERLTNTSILQSMKTIPPAEKAAELEHRRSQYIERQEAKLREERKVLHSLYVDSKDFILSETDLTKKLQQEFDKDFYQVNPDHGIWDEEGMPESIDWMMKSAEQGGTFALSYDRENVGVTRRRLQRVAEELTGGKM